MTGPNDNPLCSTAAQTYADATHPRVSTLWLAAAVAHVHVHAAGGRVQVRRPILEAFVDAFANELGAAGFAMAKVPTSGASAFDLISNDPAARSALGLTTEGQDG